MNFIDIGRSVVLKKSGSHVHDVWEIELNLVGSGTNNIDGELVNFKQGTVVCLPPSISHGKTSESGFQDTFIHCKSLNIPNQSGYTVLEDDDGAIASLFSILFDVFKKQSPSYVQISEALFEAIEQIIIGKLAVTTASPRIESIKKVILDNFHDPDFSLAELCEKSGYCDDHLRRLFRRETGMSMLEYLTELRITYAKKLLSENYRLHYTITEIGAMCGFYDTSYFSRVFKKKTGVAPSEY